MPLIKLRVPKEASCRRAMSHPVSHQSWDTKPRSSTPGLSSWKGLWGFTTYSLNPLHQLAPLSPKPHPKSLSYQCLGGFGSLPPPKAKTGNKQVPHDTSVKRRRWANTKGKEVFGLINEHWVAINFHLNTGRCVPEGSSSSDAPQVLWARLMQQAVIQLEMEVKQGGK